MLKTVEKRIVATNNMIIEVKDRISNTNQKIRYQENNNNKKK